ncbi:MAG: hypothetical protein RLZZ292_3941 [Bacteroidota bacterium]|jgi:cytochrome c oxidase subunit 2
MTALVTILCLVLGFVVLLQIGRVSELTAQVRGTEEAQRDSNKWNAIAMPIFCAVFLIFVCVTAYQYKDYMLWYGPHVSASKHGHSLDRLFNITLVVTGIVFVLTQVALFWYAYKYRGREGAKVLFIPHNNKLEIIWSAIPAVVMALLVIGGLDAWNEVMADVQEGSNAMEIEANAMQFAWNLRYPGTDGKLGTKDYKKISSSNPFGQDWTDTKNYDDFQPDEIVLPVGKPVRVRITARDVLHNFYLPHFRVKMDAIPGLPTYFVFTPELTTEQYRQNLSKSAEWCKPDPKSDDGKPMWQGFNYELACAELCGKGHYSMRRIVKIVSQEEYDEWFKKQKSWYESNVKGTDEDPAKAAAPAVLSAEGETAALTATVEKALTEANAVIKLDHVNYKTGSAELTADSKFQLDALAQIMEKHPTMTIEVEGHTDNTGVAASNLTLSQKRADAVKKYLVGKAVSVTRMQAKGYGSTKPLDTAETEEAKAKNRRTEFTILSK